MIFTSFEFVLFFMAVLSIRAVLRTENQRNWLLLIASYVFYMSWNPMFGMLIFCISTSDYFLARRMVVSTDPKHRKRLLIASLVIDLGTLLFFKYAYFVWDIAGGVSGLIGGTWQSLPLNVILPVGISFFTFQSMSYTIDVYRGRLAPTSSLRDYLLFVAFFPQLVAGPIVRAADLLPQICRNVVAKAKDVEVGLGLILLGVCKKVVISDRIAPHVDVVFASPNGFDGFSNLQALLGYTIQIYCDFSGYSDIAIGCARIMGYRFPENFRMPYSSASITEFWHRWHISLSTWLRDYLYIPLGGNRKGVARTYINLLITMVLGGLWHGASWNFIAWGGLHGAALALNKAWDAFPRIHILRRDRFRVVGRLAGWMTTMGVVMVGWALFRAQSFGDAFDCLSSIAAWKTDGVRFFSPFIWPAVLAVATTHVFLSKDIDWSEEIVKRPMWIRSVVYVFLFSAIVCFASTDASPFIYFQF